MTFMQSLHGMASSVLGGLVSTQPTGAHQQRHLQVEQLCDLRHWCAMIAACIRPSAFIIVLFKDFARMQPK